MAGDVHRPDGTVPQAKLQAAWHVSDRIAVMASRPARADGHTIAVPTDARQLAGAFLLSMREPTRSA